MTIIRPGISQGHGQRCGPQPPWGPLTGAGQHVPRSPVPPRPGGRRHRRGSGAQRSRRTAGAACGVPLRAAPPGRGEPRVPREAAGRTTGPGMPGRAPHLPGERLLFSAGPRERCPRAPPQPPRREQRPAVSAAGTRPPGAPLCTEPRHPPHPRVHPAPALPASPPPPGDTGPCRALCLQLPAASRFLPGAPSPGLGTAGPHGCPGAVAGGGCRSAPENRPPPSPAGTRGLRRRHPSPRCRGLCPSPGGVVPLPRCQRGLGDLCGSPGMGWAGGSAGRPGSGCAAGSPARPAEPVRGREGAPAPRGEAELPSPVLQRGQSRRLGPVGTGEHTVRAATASSAARAEHRGLAVAMEQRRQS